jgi:hypothetical protein
MPKKLCGKWVNADGETAFAMTECIQSSFPFEARGRREIIAVGTLDSIGHPNWISV